MRVWRRLWAYLNRNRMAAELAEEMRFHLEMKAEANRANGVAPDDAEPAARRSFGNVTLAAEESRAHWTWSWVDHLGQDLRYALRSVRNSPGFMAVAVLTLSLGVGANTAMFTLFDALVLRPLPVKDPGRLVLVKIANPAKNEEQYQYSYPFYTALRDHNLAFSGMLARWPMAMSFSTGGTAERVEGELVTGNYFEVLGSEALIGRTLMPDDDLRGAPKPVCVLSYSFWRRQFAGDPSVIGRTVLLNAQKITIVGVARRDFPGSEPGVGKDVRVPLTLFREISPGHGDVLSNRDAQWLQVIGRLKPGISPEQARQNLQATVEGIAREEKRNAAGTVELLSGSHGFRSLGEMDDSFVILLSIAAVVLLIACANVASLLIARGAARGKELALRLTLGAGRLRLLRQLLTETLFIAALGAVLGAIIAQPLISYALGFLPHRFNQVDTTPDWRVFLFFGAVIGTVTLIAGLAPGTIAVRVQIAPVLRDLASSGRARIRRVLVSLQVALAVVLLIAAGLFIQGMRHSYAVNTGIRAGSLVLLKLNPRLNGYSEPETRAFYDRLLERTRSLGGVERASIASVTPMSGAALWSTFVAEGGAGVRDAQGRWASINHVSPGYFDTLGIALLAGRDFTARDVRGGPRVAIVNEKLARLYWPGQNPLGKRIRWTFDKGTLEIVGVVRGHKYQSVREPDRPLIYTAYAQGEPSESCSNACEAGEMVLTVRTALDAATAVHTVRAEVAALDRNLPVYDARTMRIQLDMDLAPERAMSALSGGFATIAMLLAATGLYGVIAYSVARRRREIGIRMALGATRGGVVGLVLREACAVLTAGLIAGLVCGWGAARGIASLLGGIPPAGAGIYVAAGAVVTATMLASALVPAGRAARLDPMAACRYE